MTNPNKIRLEKTCGACPEQYDAFYGAKQVGYLRLRHGRFTVECPDCGGDTVYIGTPEGDGIFEDSEMEAYLSTARYAIAQWMDEQKGRAKD